MTVKFLLATQKRDPEIQKAIVPILAAPDGRVRYPAYEALRQIETWDRELF